jgi:hypothetical protein
METTGKLLELLNVGLTVDAPSVIVRPLLSGTASESIEFCMEGHTITIMTLLVGCPLQNRHVP